jgi:hypothetical protein
VYQVQKVLAGNMMGISSLASEVIEKQISPMFANLEEQISELHST